MPNHGGRHSGSSAYATRYCGDLEIRIQYDPHLFNSRFAGGRRNGAYECRIRRGGKKLGTIYVGAPEYITQAVDSPETFDEVASSALAFAAHEDEIHQRVSRGRSVDTDDVGEARDWESIDDSIENDEDGERLIRRTPRGAFPPSGQGRLF